MIGFAGTLASATYLVAELEYPRLGRVRVDAIDRQLMDLRETMNEARMSGCPECPGVRGSGGPGPRL